MRGAHALVLRHPALLLGALAFPWAIVLAGIAAGWWRATGHWLLLVLTVVAGLGLRGWLRWQRERVIRETPLPQFLKRKLRETYPQLSHKDADLVERGLRQFFLACHRSPRRFVAMPSRAADAMWHEFILHTQAYRDWCALALGRFLHHTPAEVLGAQAPRNDGLRRAWYWACKDEAINPRAPSRLPLLFALDGKLQIANGFHYVPDCRGVVARGQGGQGADGGYCATAFSDGSASGDAGGFGGAESGGDAGDGGAGGGDGGGDGGGGGCGGGGGD